MRRTTRFLAALCVAFPALACQNSHLLRSSSHLELGVRFVTRNPRIIEQSSRALKRWSEIADMTWHREDSDSCSIDIDDGAFTDVDELAEATAATGSIRFTNSEELSADELFITAFHEIGHLFGLQHNPSPMSVMYWIDVRGDEVLNQADMHALRAAHALRRDSGCSESVACRILPVALQKQPSDRERRKAETTLIAGQNWPEQTESGPVAGH